MLTETQFQDLRWYDIDLAALAEVAAKTTLVHLGLDPDQWTVAILACDDARIATLNADFRGKAQPTNVLSWPSEERAAQTAGTRPDLPVPGPDPELGDIAISFDTCASEAQAASKPLADHTTHLIVHATLHLLGYDHIRDQDATLMETTETDILGKLGLPDPY